MMPRVRNQSLGGRADQAGLLFAAGNTPLTFQRTLMPRAHAGPGARHRALGVGEPRARHAGAGDDPVRRRWYSSGQAGRRSVDEKRWGRATVAADVAAIGAGLASQRVARQRNREPLARAGARTGGFRLAMTGTAGAVVGRLAGSACPATARAGAQTLAVVGPAGAARWRR